MSWTPDEDLTPAEEARFADLPRTAPVDHLAEERAVRALRAEGLLRTPALAAPRRRGRLLWVPLRIAAGLALFVTGVAYGRRAAPDAPPLRPSAPVSVAEEVQRTGTAYVDALARLGAAPATRDTQIVAAGVEIAAVTLRAATVQLARLEADSALAKRLTLRLQPPAPVVWF